MKLANSIEINKSKDEIWKVLATDFDKAEVWMSSVPKSYKKEEGSLAPGAPMKGRICELSLEDNPPKAVESILEFDKTNYRMKVLVKLENGSIPVDHNNTIFEVKKISEEVSEVTLNSDITLTLKGKILSPALKFALKKNFTAILEELKYYVENGFPHPRKQKKSFQQNKSK